MTTQYIYKKYRSTKTILCNYSRYPLLIIQLRVSFPFVTIIAYDLARGVTQIKLLFLCFFCVKNERAKYYIFRWLCITLLCKVYFFFLPVAGRRKKNKGYGQMLLYFLGASKMTMLYVITNVVAAIAGKALIVAKVALAIATAIGLKRILGIPFWFLFWNFLFQHDDVVNNTSVFIFRE